MIIAQEEKRTVAKIYISGPITGNPNYKEQFAAISRMLETDGHIVVDPSVETEGLSPRDYMRISLARLESADEILLLPGWENSKGAKIEKLYAEYIGLRVREYTGGHNGKR